MPRLSAVVVAHREQGFIRPCVQSVLAGADRCGRGDVDVVVVVDAPADHSGEIAGEVAAGDSRVRVIELADRRGPGPARAAGLAAAAGDHVWFVSAFDLLLPEALPAVLDQARGTDLLTVRHVVRDVFGTERPGPAGPTGHLWDRVVRTSLARETSGLFAAGPGWERETVVRLRVAARSEAVTAHPAYVRRDLPRVLRERSEPGSADTARPATTDCDVRHDRRKVSAAERHSRQGGSRLAARARRGLRLARRPRRLAAALRRAPMTAYYRWQLTRPLEPDLVAYAAYWYAGYSCNPRAIYERARELAPRLRGVWIVDAGKAHLVPPGVEHVAPDTRAYWRLLARATYLVNNVNFPNEVVKRPGQVHVQTHHGTPLKTMGMDLVGSPYSQRRMNFPKLLRRAARWDWSVSQNVFTSEYWERVYPSGTYRSIETGYPRNDVLARATEADVAKARSALGLQPGQTSVLYLPTHREYQRSYVPQLDPARLADALGPSYVLLMRTHYFYRDALPESGDARVRNVGDHPRIEDLYLAADVLVTDYSSAMFDYAVLDRPIVIYAPDWEEYRTRRGTTFDLMAEPPGAVARTEAELAEVLASRRAWDDDASARRQQFRARFCSLEDGRAAERVVRAVWPRHVEDR